DGTLNAITVDGDTSTNDTVLLLAGGAAANRTVATGSRDHLRLTRAVTEVLGEIARLVVLDGEGSTRVVEIVVRGARSAADARRVARAIGDSMLCKAAFHGGDPNWGRFVMAAGNAGVPRDQTRVDVTIGGRGVARRVAPLMGRSFSFPRVYDRVFEVLLVAGVLASWRRRDLGSATGIGFRRSAWARDLARGFATGLAGLAVGLALATLLGGL